MDRLIWDCEGSFHAGAVVEVFFEELDTPEEKHGRGACGVRVVMKLKYGTDDGFLVERRVVLAEVIREKFADLKDLRRLIRVTPAGREGEEKVSRPKQESDGAPFRGSDRISDKFED